MDIKKKLREEIDKVSDNPSSQYNLNSGEPVNITGGHIHKGLEPLLPEVLSKVSDTDANSEGLIIKTVDVGRVVGKNNLVKVDSNDKIYYKRRGDRKGKSKMVANRKPEDSSEVTIIMQKQSNGGYQLYTIFVGPPAEQEPWDENVRDKQKSIEFWKNHALVDEE